MKRLCEVIILQAVSSILMLIWGIFPAWVLLLSTVLSLIACYIAVRFALDYREASDG